MVVAWYTLKVLFRNKPKLRVMGLYGCTHKTVAMGVPLINAIYENNAAVGLYTLPLLIWHPMQLVIGTFLSPRLTRFVQSENERLGISEDEGEEFEVEQDASNPVDRMSLTEEGQATSEENTPEDQQSSQELPDNSS